MNLENLLKELKKGSQTLGWGAVLAVSQRVVNEQLARSYDATASRLAAMTARVNLLADASEYLQVKALGFGAPSLRLGKSAGSGRAAVRIPLVAGAADYRQIPGQTASTGRLLTTLSVSEEAAYHLDVTAEVKLAIDAFGNRAHVFLDLSSVSNASSNLWPIEEGARRIASTMQAHINSLPKAFAQVPLATIDLNVRDAFSVRDLQVTFQANPDDPDDGALLVFMRLNVDDTVDPSMPGPDYPYLIPSDTDQAGNPSYGVTWLIREDLAGLLDAKPSAQQPACMVQTAFGDGQVMAESKRHVPRDWAVFGKLKGAGGGLTITPANPQLVAGQKVEFSAQLADGTVPTGILWVAPRADTAGAQAGTIDALGKYTAPAADTFPQDVIQVTVRAQRSANGQTLEASTVLSIRRAAVMQQTPMQVVNLWREDNEITAALAALSVSESDLQWALADTPLAGEAVMAETDSPRRARYTPPKQMESKLAVRWVQASQSGSAVLTAANRAGLLVLSSEHALSVEPAVVEPMAAGTTQAFKVLELNEGRLTLPDGRNFDVQADPPTWSVMGEGSITEGGVYTPAQKPTLPFDVVYFDFKGLFAGYAVVKTAQARTTDPAWEDLAKFSLTADYGNSVYANGGQQLPIKVTITTKAVSDPLSGTLHLPISDAELATVRLVDKNSRQVLTTLEPYEEGLGEGLLWATQTARNAYDLPQVGASQQGTGIQAEGDVERTRSRVLYVHTRAGASLEVAATFTATGGIGGPYYSDGASYEGPTSLTLIPEPVPSLERKTYLFPDGRDEPQNSRLEKPVYWRGQEYTGSQNELEGFYGTASDTTTYYPLKLAEGRFLSLGLISVAEGVKAEFQAVPMNQARWESDYWGEGGFSYTAAALHSKSASAQTPPARFLGIGLPLRLLDAQQRNLGLPVVMPAQGPYPDAPKPVPLFDRLARDPAEGTVSIVLERRGDMLYQWDGDAAGERLSQWREALAAPIGLRLRDNLGNLHRLQVDFAQQDALTSGRNDLRLSVLAPTLPAGGSGSDETGPSASPSGGPSPRAPSSALHSNAFNFLSFLEGGVDPRTGQYTLQLAFPQVSANQLAGPELALRLAFDPFTTVDAGYGLGWALNLSQVDTYGQGRLRLSSGEAFALNTLSADGEYQMVERKVPVCRLYKDGAAYRLVHRDGTVEQLEVPGVGGLALPRVIYSATGHSLHFSYAGYEGHARLERITDGDGRVLLSIEPVGGNLLKFAFQAQGQAEAVAFTAELTARRLERLVLPTLEQASWRLQYRDINGYPCLSEVRTPAGGVETLEYDSTGHGVPGDAKPRLPRVAMHRLSPGQGQAPQVTEYSYSQENFLGYPSVSEWQEEQDNLYRAAWDFTYWSEATHVSAGARRKVTRIYNSLHLLQEERTEQNGHVHTVSSKFHWRPGEAFNAQPNQCQLPKKVTTQWRLEGQAAARDEVVETDYDSHGNLLREVAATGVITEYTYYPGDRDSEGCPKDPHGFTQYEHTHTVVPATRFAEPGAPRLVTSSTYVLAPALPGSLAAGPVLKRTESLQESGQPVPARQVTYSWYVDPGEAFTLGRLASEDILLWGDATKVSQNRYAYSLGDDEAGNGTVLKTDITTEGFDGALQVKHLEQSTVTGLMLLERDSQGGNDDVDIRRRYDALQRVTEETIAPGTPQQASRQYSYRLVDGDGAVAEQTVTDVLGVRLRTQVDGLGRAFAEYRREPDASAEMQTYDALYDGLGQLVEASEWDDFGPQRSAVPMTERYEYDDWGQLRATLGADGVRRVEETDPLGVVAEGVTRIRRTWLESQDGSLASGVEVTYENAFEQTLKTSREEQPGAAATPLYTYGYDGLGRRVSERDPLNRQTRHRYDLFDRDVETTLPDGARVLREYAEHSSEDLPTRISVLDSANKEHLLGTQAFDGVGRMTAAVTGGRPRHFSYKLNQTRPETVVTPKGVTLVYEYQPRLGEQPILRRVGEGDAFKAGTEEHYEYDPRDARLVRCLRAQEEVLTRSYHSNGKLLNETRQFHGKTLSMVYAYSVQERLLSYTDVTGQTQTYTYDARHGGRLQATRLDGLTCALDYDALGRDACVTTTDTEAGTALATHLSYDTYGRETERRFVYAGGEQDTLSQTYDALDRITSKTLTSAESGVLREETFEYDSRGRLSYYTCAGPECPLDPYGHPITSQIFECDALDNHTLVITTWTDSARGRAELGYRSGKTDRALAALAGEGMNVALYLFENPDDPAQLTGIVNDGEGYPPNVNLEYDADGNLLNDEWGRQFDYDALGRLIAVSALDGETSSTYQYDPLDVISARGEPTDAAAEGRFYRDGVLHSLLDQDGATVIVRAGEHLLAEQHPTSRPNA